MGVSASMLWWEEGFCRLLADGGRFVVRYDHRDTGRSVTYEPGRPEYTGADLLADAVGVLGVYGVTAAHVVGVSAGGAFAQLLAIGFPDRVLSLTLISTSPAIAGERSLPSPTGRFNAPGAKLLTLEGAGHGVDRADWERVCHAILAHTGVAQPAVE
jgi:pimeloyl-ACP methyl ester carboxylesterase